MRMVFEKNVYLYFNVYPKKYLSEKKPVLVTFCLMQTYLLSKDYGFLSLVFAAAGIVTI